VAHFVFGGKRFAEAANALKKRTHLKPVRTAKVLKRRSLRQPNDVPR
jgi:hypothetical protein